MSFLTQRGYVIEYKPGHPAAQKNGSIRVHRRVWFDMYGPIPKGWVIHHKNGNRLDNRPENLELHNKTTHTRLHNLERAYGPAWNKGTTEYVVLGCVVCGKRVRRKKEVWKKGIKRGYEICCSHRCSGRLSATLRLVVGERERRSDG